MREADPEGNRTIGVLTKPDRIEDNCHQSWLDILYGSALSLKLGYYMVKNPTQVKAVDVAMDLRTLDTTYSIAAKHACSWLTVRRS